MRADTKTITIQANAAQILSFLTEPANLPRWAVGFAKAARRDGERWIVTTGGGEVAVRVVAEPTLGVIDFYMSVAPGIEALAATRVVPSGDEVEYVFTQFQLPGMPDDVFAKNVRTLEHELTVLKALLEVDCPL